MQQKMPRNTVYRQFIIKTLCDWHEQGRAFFTLKEFSERSGLKVTGNMRKQFKSFVAEGSLIPFWALNLNRGSVVVYQFADTQLELELCHQPEQ